MPWGRHTTTTTMSVDLTHSLQEVNLYDAFHCNICTDRCEFPVLFPCREHYYCAVCIRRWIASSRQYDKETGSYVFDTTCPKCRLLVPGCDAPLDLAPMSIISTLHGKQPLPCPFCNTRNADKEHVAACGGWKVKCEHCTRQVPYAMLQQHKAMCTWSCTSVGCIDGHDLSRDEQMHHLDSHMTLDEATVHLLNTLTNKYPTHSARAAAAAVMRSTADALQTIYRQTNNIMEEDDDDEAPPPYTTASDLVDNIEAMKEIEDMLLRHNIPDDDKRAALRGRWYQLNDAVPKMTIHEWEMQPMWHQLPLNVKHRLINPVLSPPH